ncbi:MAG: HAD-IA family hydrolase [Candidatus Promineifilaceae bacterium]|jgi:HAD superfamily hydrolase (TIGR01509 family)
MMKALIFDCDGVLADTERDGHLVAFNQMWRENGVDWQWSLEQYAEKVKIGGGKERMFSLGKDDDFRAVYDVPDSDEAWWEIVAGWHKRKSEIYKDLIASGALPGRPGVRRLAEEAHEQGWTLVVCSTSALSSVKAVLNHVMGEETAANFDGVFAGDMVKAKKPAPDIYNLAVEQLNLDPSDCVVVEDSRNGLLAAVAAGMNTIVTFNQLTENEDFSEADIVVSSLGDPDGEKTIVFQNHTQADPSGYVKVSDLDAILNSSRN